MTAISKIAVVGAGSWGTALAILLADNGYQVSLWGHRRDEVDRLCLERENSRYLANIPFPEKLSPQKELHICLQDAAMVVMAVPSHGFRDVFNEVAPLLKKDAIVLSAVKGIEDKSLKTMTAVMEEILERCDCSRRIKTGVISGPSFALEVARQLPTAVTIGYQDIVLARTVQDIFKADYFRVYTSCDVLGLEIAAAFKNIIAIATGVCDGLGFGLNARAALITRGLAEIRRLGLVLGASPATFAGLSGIGDLLLTCTGDLSRNRRVGLELSKEKTLSQIVDEMEMVAEGIKTTKSGYKLAKKYGVEMPILEQVYTILYCDGSCREAVSYLLERDAKEE